MKEGNDLQNIGKVLIDQETLMTRISEMGEEITRTTRGKIWLSSGY